MHRHSGVEPFENSLTVAGAAPALLCEQRTGFPFHPLENILGTPETREL
jgi:hypothetical protein